VVVVAKEREVPGVARPLLAEAGSTMAQQVIQPEVVEEQVVEARMPIPLALEQVAPVSSPRFSAPLSPLVAVAAAVSIQIFLQ
jgi:hypothetical protein